MVESDNEKLDDNPCPKAEFGAIGRRLLQRRRDNSRKKEPALQRSAKDSIPDTVPPIVHEVLRSPGQSLDPAARAFMQQTQARVAGCLRMS